MVDTVVESLILDLLDWLTERNRTYDEAIEAWRTSCPKLPVWEDATDRGLVAIEVVNGTSIVRVTPPGLTLLSQRKRTDCHLT